MTSRHQLAARQFQAYIQDCEAVEEKIFRCCCNDDFEMLKSDSFIPTRSNSIVYMRADRIQPYLSIYSFHPLFGNKSTIRVYRRRRKRSEEIQRINKERKAIAIITSHMKFKEIYRSAFLLYKLIIYIYPFPPSILHTNHRVCCVYIYI